MLESSDIRLKRLRYRSWHRGCKETDLILGHFGDRHLDSLAAGELDAYEALLEENDNDIWAWLGGNPAPARYHRLMDLLRAFKDRDPLE